MPHVCKFERPRLKIELVLCNINGVVHFVEWINMRWKKQKKTRNILQCHVCGRYQVECPYCQEKQVMAELPKKTICEHCGKEFRVEWTRI